MARGRVLPNFLIIGAEKAGTSWLHSTLRHHPEVFMPGTKEAHFFNAVTSNLEPRDFYDRLGIEWYARFFDRCSGQVAVGESTPMYLCDAAAPGRIQATLPDVRFICSLRDPISRAYSHYSMAASKGHTARSFHDVVDADEERFIGRGDYAVQLARYWELFPRERFLILIFEELFTDTTAQLRVLLEFLKVDTSWASENLRLGAPENAAATYRSLTLLHVVRRTAIWMRTHRGFDRLLDATKASGVASALKDGNRLPGGYPPMDPELRERLALRYEPGVRRLEAMLGRTLPWLNSSRPGGVR